MNPGLGGATSAFGGGSSFGNVYSNGVPLLPGVLPCVPAMGGQVFFVDATYGAGGMDRGAQDKPLATIDQALDRCVSGRGDVIIINPGTYAENVVIDKDYITLIGGFVSGYARPDIVPAAGLALSVDNAQGFVAIRCRFASDGQDSDVCRIEGNGWKLIDCVLDGDAAMGDTKAILRLWCDTADDSYTASEGRMEDCLVRGSGGFGIAFDVQHATVGVGPTHCYFRGVRFLANDKEDVMALETAAGTYSIQDTVFEGCHFLSRNKATHVDIDTNNGATNTGVVFLGCTFWDDTLDTTAVKVATANGGLIGCSSLDGVADGDALD